MSDLPSLALLQRQCTASGEGAARSKPQEGGEGDGGGIANNMLLTLFNIDQEVVIAQFMVDDSMSPEVVVDIIWKLCRGVSKEMNASALCTRLWQTIYTRIIESPYLSLLESYPFSNGFDIRTEPKMILVKWYRIMLRVNLFCESLRALWALILPLIDEENQQTDREAKDKEDKLDTLDLIDANFFIDFNARKFFQEQRNMMNDAYHAAELSVTISMMEVHITDERASAQFSRACKQACGCLGNILGIVGDLEIVDDSWENAADYMEYDATGFQYTAECITNASWVLEKQTLVHVLRKFVELQNREGKQDCSWMLVDSDAPDRDDSVDCRVHIKKTNAIKDAVYII